MRVNTWKAGVVIAAAILLTGCSGQGPAEKPSDSKPSSSSSAEETTAPSSDCPKLEEGATVDISALAICSTERMAESKGYAATSTTMGMESTARYNPADDATAIDSSIGSMVVIGDQAWVKSPSSEWQVADPNSTDPIIAGLSAGATTATSTDPAQAAAALNGEFTVTGTSERLGQKVYLVSGTTDSQGVAVDATFEVTEDYIILATTTKTEVQGQPIEASLEITEWDVPQEVTAPM